MPSYRLRRRADGMIELTRGATMLSIHEDLPSAESALGRLSELPRRHYVGVTMIVVGQQTADPTKFFERTIILPNRQVEPTIRRLIKLLDLKKRWNRRSYYITTGQPR